MKPGLYVHIPFCATKCAYCGFASEAGQEALIPDYLDALEREASEGGRPSVATVYIGGGTPTLLDGAELERLFKIIRMHFVVEPGTEFTVEANPGTLTRSKIELLRRRGVNRVSLGVQSFEEDVLCYLGRTHSSSQVAAAWEDLRSAGFDNLNLDLIFGFPERSREGLDRDLELIRRFGPEHVSLYMLSVELVSRFGRAGKPMPDPDRQAGDFVFVSDRLTGMGYDHYEVSNFSKPARACLHNLNYWAGGDYIGLGAAAHSHLSGVRSWNVATIAAYRDRMRRSSRAREGEETLSAERRLSETLLLSLRTSGGADLSRLEERFGVRLPPEFFRRVDDFVREGYLILDGDRLFATRRGWLVLDELSPRLL